MFTLKLLNDKRFVVSKIAFLLMSNFNSTYAVSHIIYCFSGDIQRIIRLILLFCRLFTYYFFHTFADNIKFNDRFYVYFRTIFAAVLLLNDIKIKKMKKLCVTFAFIIIFSPSLFSIPNFYLITIGEAKEPYAMYGHTAIRIADTALNMDFIVDWGVFNFDQPNFYINFAKGNMIYTTEAQSFQSFLYYNHRSGKGAVMEEILLNNEQKERFWMVLSKMLEPENRDYRYRFIYDNCATRPRDLLEIALQDELYYPENQLFTGTYRKMLHDYQSVNLWYNLLIDIILGSRIDIKPDIREQMFLPEYLRMYWKSSYVVDIDGVHPLLGDIVILNEKTPLSKTPFLLSPEVIFILLFLALLILDFLKKGRRFLRIFDMVFFGILLFFSLLIMFLWGISEHQEAYDNCNLLWLTPLYIFTLIGLIKNKKPLLIATCCYLLLFFILDICQVFPQQFPFTAYIITFIIMERCGAACFKDRKPIRQ